MNLLLLAMVLSFTLLGFITSSKSIENPSKSPTEYVEYENSLESESDDSSSLSSPSIQALLHSKSTLMSLFKEKVYGHKSNNTLFKPPIFI